jgi:hypothetical protein
LAISPFPEFKEKHGHEYPTYVSAILGYLKTYPGTSIRRRKPVGEGGLSAVALSPLAVEMDREGGQALTKFSFSFNALLGWRQDDDPDGSEGAAAETR